MTEESKELTKIEPVVPPQVVDPELADEMLDRLVVVAKDTEQLNQSQVKLTEWAGKKVAKERAELKELQENLSIATTRKWRTTFLQKLVNEKKNLVKFYEKVEAALKAGYYIVPDFPMDVFAIRTTQRNVSRNKAIGVDYTPLVDNQDTNLPPVGQGRYESPDARIGFQRKKLEPAAPGRDPRTQNIRYAIDWGTIDFPFLATAKPDVIKATTAAMDKLIFDEMGVAPQQPRADPMVMGRVMYRKGYTRRQVTFLVAWFLDTDEL